MKIFALSGGRAWGNNEILLRIALEEAQNICGVEYEICRMHDLNIKDCVGCETCMRGLNSGGDGFCVIKDDDLGWIREHLSEADGFLVTAPVYDMAPSGSLVTLLNRALGIGREFQLECRKRPKVGAVITLGGSDWVNFSEPITDLLLCNLSKSAVVVDRMVVTNFPAPGSVLMDDSVLERAKILGQRVGQALLLREKGEGFQYEGDSGVCPVCHCKLLEMETSTTVKCPYCDSHAELAVVDGNIVLQWDEESLLNNRFSLYGQNKHRADIAVAHKKTEENKQIILKRMAQMKEKKDNIVCPERRK